MYSANGTFLGSVLEPDIAKLAPFEKLEAKASKYGLRYVVFKLSPFLFSETKVVDKNSERGYESKKKVWYVSFTVLFVNCNLSVVLQIALLEFAHPIITQC
jgi:hypothetical protein